MGALLACGVSGVSSLRSLQSRLPFVVCPPFLSLFDLHLLLWWVGWSQVCGTSCCSCVWSSGGVSPSVVPRLGFCLWRLFRLGLVCCGPAGVPAFFSGGTLLPLSWWFSLGSSYSWLSRLLAFSSSLLGFFPLASSFC